MSAAPTILLAKYASDLLRMEPRNVGVVVWSSGVTVAKFLGESQDGRVRIPKVVSDSDRRVYKEWIYYWKAILQNSSLKSRNGELIDKKSPQYLQLLKEKSKPKFFLVDAGSMMVRVQDRDIHELTEDLFEALVQHVSPELQEYSRSLRRSSEEVFAKAEVDVKKRHSLICPVLKVQKEFTFDYAITNDDKTQKLFQRIILPKQSSVNSAAFMFEQLKKSRKKKDIGRYSLVYKPTNGTANETHKSLEQSIAILEKLSTKVIDVSNVDDAVSVVRSLAT